MNKKIINLILAFFLLLNFVLAENKLIVKPNSNKNECIFNRLKLDLETNETLALTRIKLKTNDKNIILRNDIYNNTNYFENENKFRVWRNLIEFFDKNPKYENGSITVEFLNKSNDYNLLAPGKHHFELYPFLQRKDNYIIPIKPVNLTFIMSSLAEDFNAKTINRLNWTNTAVMGEQLTLKLNATEGYWFDNIDYAVYYDDELFDDGEVNIDKNSTNQTFFERIDTKTKDLQDIFVCPRHDLKIILSDPCSEKIFYVKQVPPKPTDIYYQVDRYFRTKDKIRIVRIYYMAGAYFNCLDENAKESFA